MVLSGWVGGPDGSEAKSIACPGGRRVGFTMALPILGAALHYLSEVFNFQRNV
jgi:hypothetical protein